MRQTCGYVPVIEYASTSLSTLSTGGGIEELMDKSPFREVFSFQHFTGISKSLTVIKIQQMASGGRHQELPNDSNDVRNEDDRHDRRHSRLRSVTPHDEAHHHNFPRVGIVRKR